MEWLATALAECQMERARSSRALAEAKADHAAELEEPEARMDRLLAGQERELTRITDELAESETDRGHLESRQRRSEAGRGRAEESSTGDKTQLLRLTDELAKS